MSNPLFQERPSEKKEFDFDDLLPYVGEFGRYQKILVWLICLPACIPCGFHAFNQLFMAGVPDHWCKAPPETDSYNWTVDERKMATIPHTVGTSLSFDDHFDDLIA